MEKQGFEKLRLLFLGGVALLCLFFFDYLCPLRYLAGISCPGCGVTRSWIALLGGDLGEAFRLHPLFWLPPVAAGLWIFRRKKVCGVLFGLALAGFLALWVVRLTDPADSVAVFAPASGMVFQGIKRLWEALFA